MEKSLKTFLQPEFSFLDKIDQQFKLVELDTEVLSEEVIAEDLSVGEIVNSKVKYIEDENSLLLKLGNKRVLKIIFPIKATTEDIELLKLGIIRNIVIVVYDAEGKEIKDVKIFPGTEFYEVFSEFVQKMKTLIENLEIYTSIYDWEKDDYQFAYVVSGLIKNTASALMSNNVTNSDFKIHGILGEEELKKFLETQDLKEVEQNLGAALFNLRKEGIDNGQKVYVYFTSLLSKDLKPLRTAYLTSSKKLSPEIQIIFRKSTIEGKIIASIKEILFTLNTFKGGLKWPQ